MKRTPLTEEEKEYLTYDLDALYYVPKEEEVKRSLRYGQSVPVILRK